MDVDEIKQSDFSCVYTNSGKLKVSLIIFESLWSKMGATL